MRAAAALLLTLGQAPALVCAVPVNYEIDPDHTHPAFEADHFGMSLWRGFFRKASGTVTLDAEAGTGAVDIDVDIASVDFGNDKLNDTAVNASAPPIFEAAKYPTTHYHGTLGGFVNGAPTTLTGSLTLHGVTRPLTLTINQFKCIPNHPIVKREVCGADATGTFNRADFGITVGKLYGFKMDVTLRIQVEAIKAEPVATQP